jgi:hypothetical protein
MADNKTIKDGLGSPFTLRMRDVSAAQDGSLFATMVRATLLPIEYGTGGSFQHTAKSGVMAAGLAAAAPIYAFRWPAASLALVRRIKLSAWTAAVGFAAGMASFDVMVARAFTAQYTGGSAADLSGNNTKLRTSMAGSLALIQYAGTAALTPGTRTLDADPADTLNVAAPTTVSTVIATATLFAKAQGEHPLLLAQNEGFAIRATVPATGTWQFAVTAEWDEIQVF